MNLKVKWYSWFWNYILAFRIFFLHRKAYNFGETFSVGMQRATQGQTTALSTMGVRLRGGEMEIIASFACVPPLH